MQSKKRSRETATHEIADCTSDEIVAPASAKWEPCVIIRQTRDVYDVKIISDGAVCVDVPKRFVRPLRATGTRQQESTPRKRVKYGWNQRECELLLSAEKARLEVLSCGGRASQRNAWIGRYLSERGVRKRLESESIHAHVSLSLNQHSSLVTQMLTVQIKFDGN